MKINYLESFTEPKVQVTYEAYRKMRNYVGIHDEELGWFGIVEKIDDDVYVITDTVLPEQEVTSTYNEIDEKTMIKMASKLTSEQISKIKCYGHSHVNMGVSPSSTDKEQVEELTNGSSWFITVINNKDDDWHVAFNDYSKGIQYQYDYLPIYVAKDEAIEKEIKDKVITRKSNIQSMQDIAFNDYYSRYYGYQPSINAVADDDKDRIKTMSKLIKNYIKNLKNRKKSEQIYEQILTLSCMMKDCANCEYGIDSNYKCSALAMAGAVSKYGFVDEICPKFLGLDDFYILYDYEDVTEFDEGIDMFLEDMENSIGGKK